MLVSTVTATTLKPVDRLLVHLCHVLKLLSRNFETILLKCAHFPTDLTESLWRLFFDQWWWKPTPLWSWRASCVHALTEEEPVGFDQETKRSKKNNNKKNLPLTQTPHPPPSPPTYSLIEPACWFISNLILVSRLITDMFFLDYFFLLVYL